MANDAEDRARRRLKRNRALAGGLLLASAAILVATHLAAAPNFYVLLIRAAAEAGIVGGLADWFAVTALFRRPLGLPIPHTAIIPNNKDRIAEALGRFVERNFLTEETVLRKIRAARAAERFTTWLAAPATAAAIAGAVVKALPYIIRSLQDSDLQRFAQSTIGEQLKHADAAALLARAVHILGETGEAEVLLARAIGIAETWLLAHKSEIDEIVRERTPWWVPRRIDRRIAAAIVDGLIDLLSELREENSDARRRFKAALGRLSNELLHSRAQREAINASKNRILESSEFQAWLGSIWRELSRTVLDDLAQPQPRTRTAIEKATITLGTALSFDRAVQAQIESLIERLAIYLVSWRSEIGLFISEVVKSWDTAVLTERLELVVGSDLQYIRMNGTIVGAIAGCLIFLISQLLH